MGASEEIDAALIIDSTQRRGEVMKTGVSGGTGQIAVSPFKGSRIIELKNVDAALLGLPGRTTIVGNLKTRPSIKPLRE